MGSITERVQIRCEICLESIMDRFNSISDSLRRPLMIFAAVALVMTLRTAKKTIRRTKPTLLAGANPTVYRQPTVGVSTVGVGGVQPVGAAGGSMYGRAMTAPNQPLGGAAVAGGGLYGQNTVGAAGSMYGQQNTAGAGVYGQQNSVYGASNTLGGVGGAAAGGMAAAPGARATADLVDRHGGTGAVAVVEPGLLKDFGGQAEFSGQVDTLVTYEGYGFVQQVLSQPGQNKVLVVDGGGSLRASIFDAALAQLAQRNGWRGVIVNGAVRNARSLSSVGFGVKALGTSPVKGGQTAGAAMPGGVQQAGAVQGGGQGQRGVAVQFGNVQFNPGWWVYADRDGIVVSQTDVGGTVPAVGGVGGVAGGVPGAYGTNAMAGGVRPVGGAAGSVYGAQQQQVQPGGLRGTAGVAGQPQQQLAAGAAPRQVGSMSAARPASAAAAGAPPPRRHYTNTRSSKKKFMGKFIGFCFLLMSFLLLMNSS